MCKKHRGIYRIFYEKDVCYREIPIFKLVLTIFSSRNGLTLNDVSFILKVEYSQRKSIHLSELDY